MATAAQVGRDAAFNYSVAPAEPLVPDVPVPLVFVFVFVEVPPVKVLFPSVPLFP